MKRIILLPSFFPIVRNKVKVSADATAKPCDTSGVLLGAVVFWKESHFAAESDLNHFTSGISRGD